MVSRCARKGRESLEEPVTNELIREIYNLTAYASRAGTSGQFTNILHKITHRTDFLRDYLIVLGERMRAAGVSVPWDPEPIPEGWTIDGPITDGIRVPPPTDPSPP